MEIKIREVSRDYVEIIIEYWGTKIDMGLHNVDQVNEVISSFDNAIGELQKFIEHNHR